MMGATKAPMPKEKWMVCMNGPESNPCQLSKQRALPPEIRTTLYGLVFLKWAIPSLFLFIFVFSIQFTANRWYNVCQRLDLNWGPLVLEATALPYEPQPLPCFNNLRLSRQLTLKIWLEKLVYSEIMYSGWLKLIKWLATSNQRALLTSGLSTLV